MVLYQILNPDEFFQHLTERGLKCLRENRVGRSLLHGLDDLRWGGAVDLHEVGGHVREVVIATAPSDLGQGLRMRISTHGFLLKC